jgi:NitT/TauT family transport system substrate-binding protein
MRTKHKIILKIVFGIVLLLTLTIFSASCNKPEKSAGPKDIVTIGVAEQILSAPLIIAAEKGYFADEGLNVTIRNYKFGRLCLEAMFAGEVNLSTNAQMPVVMNGFKRDDFSIIAEFAYNDDDSKMVVRKDRIRTGADLKGKKIGTPFGTSAHFFLDIYLNYSNVPKTSVEVIDILAQNLPDAMKTGKVDAISSFEPYAYETLQLLQDKATRMDKIELFREAFIVVGMKDFINNHPEALNKLLCSIERGIAFIKKNKRETMQILAKKLKVDDKFLEAAWDGYVFDLSLNHSLLIVMEDQARWAIENKMTDKTKVPNYLNYFYLDAIKEVKPETVTIVK